MTWVITAGQQVLTFHVGLGVEVSLDEPIAFNVNPHVEKVDTSGIIGLRRSNSIILLY